MMLNPRIISYVDHDIAIIEYPDGTIQAEISRRDGREIASWDVLQSLKEKVFGDVQAVEIYPTRKNLVNNANARHLFLLPMPLVQEDRFALLASESDPLEYR